MAMTAVGGASAFPSYSEHVVTLEIVTDLLLTMQDGSAAGGVSDRLCEAVCAVTASDRAAIFEYDALQRRVSCAGSFGIPETDALRSAIDIESISIAVRALSSDRVLRADPLSEALPAFMAEWLGAESVVCCTPMVAAGSWVGFILSSCVKNSRRMDGEESLLWTLGKTAALASVARLATANDERARQLEERIGLAREIHDSAMQRIWGVYLALSGEPLGGEVQDRCAEELESALGELRAAIQRPLSPSVPSTGTSLLEEIKRMAAHHPEMQVKVIGCEPMVVPAQVDALAQAVLAESVRNAFSHGDPRHLDVRLERTDCQVTLDIVNDGVELANHSIGVGLRLVALQALSAGAILQFGESGEGSWQVHLEAPVGTS